MNSLRIVKLMGLAGATVLMGAGAYLAQSGLNALALERQQAAQVMARLDGARRLLPEAEKREALVRSVQEVTAKVGETGFDPAQWGERRLRRAPAAAARGEVADFLRELRSGGGRALFVADAFELAVQTKESGLFHPPLPGDQGLMFGVAGTLYFKTASAPARRP